MLIHYGKNPVKMNYPIHENHGFHPSYKHFVPLEYIAQRDNTCEVVKCTPSYSNLAKNFLSLYTYSNKT